VHVSTGKVLWRQALGHLYSPFVPRSVTQLLVAAGGQVDVRHAPRSRAARKALSNALERASMQRSQLSTTSARLDMASSSGLGPNTLGMARALWDCLQ
jgi:hypothetical protein